MRTAACRLHKGFSLEKRMEGAKAALEFDPSARRGAWRRWAPEGGVRPDGEAFSRVVLDLGCGKGEYTVARAEADPETLFVGIDVDPICVMRSAEAACEAGVGNVVFVHDEDPDVLELFGEGELASILINFPTPFPKKKRASRRLTYLDRLMKYRRVLEEGGTVRMRTDSTPFRDFSLTQLNLAGYQLEWETDDVRGMFPDEPWSGYERKLVAKGAPVVGFCAVPGPAPEHVEQTAPLSLVSYLPEDLENLDYIPFGMQGLSTTSSGTMRTVAKKGCPIGVRPSFSQVGRIARPVLRAR